MRLKYICVLILVRACLVEGYRTFSMRDLNSCSKPIELNLSSTRWNSSGILVDSLEGTYEPGLHCEVILRPPLAYGIVVSIRYLDLPPFSMNSTACENYLEIKKLGRHDSKGERLCGYSYDEYEFQSYTYWGRTNIIFHTSANPSQIHKATFQLTFTAIRKGNNWCFGEERRCHNGHCIWDKLACDGHNNCGDVSDELNKFVSQCSAMSASESLAVILITIVGSLILLVIAAYLRGPKISQQIERLSATRSPNTQNVSEEAANGEVRNNAVGRTSRRNNQGSTAGLMSPYYEAATNDPPPSYEDVVGIPANSNRSSYSRERSYTTRSTVIAERPTTSIYRTQSIG